MPSYSHEKKNPSEVMQGGSSESKKNKNKNKAFILNASLACLPEETCILINTKVGSYEGLRKYVLGTRRTTKDRGWLHRIGVEAIRRETGRGQTQGDRQSLWKHLAFWRVVL